MRKRLVFLIAIAFIITPLMLGLTSCKKKLTHVEEVKSTCLETGLKEHWVDKKGNIYLDDKGKKESTKEGITLPRVKLIYVEKVEATLVDPGHIDYYKCPICGKKYSKDFADESLLLTDEDIVIPPLGKATLVAAKEATCKEAGNIEYYKHTNGKTYKDAKCTEEITAIDYLLPKVELEKVEYLEASVGSEGHLEHYKCPKCGKIYKTGEALDEYELDDITFSYVEEVPATCLAKGVKEHYVNKKGVKFIDKYLADVAEDIDLEIAKLTLTKVDRLEPTYLEEGHIEYYECKKCGKLYSKIDPTEADEISLEDTILAVKNISYETNIKEPSYKTTGKLILNTDDEQIEVTLPMISHERYTCMFNNRVQPVNEYQDIRANFIINENTLTLGSGTNLTQDMIDYLVAQDITFHNMFLPAKYFRGYVNSVKPLSTGYIITITIIAGEYKRGGKLKVYNETLPSVITGSDLSLDGLNSVVSVTKADNQARITVATGTGSYVASGDTVSTNEGLRTKTTLNGRLTVLTDKIDPEIDYIAFFYLHETVVSFNNPGHSFVAGNTYSGIQCNIEAGYYQVGDVIEIDDNGTTIGKFTVE